MRLVCNLRQQRHHRSLGDISALTGISRGQLSELELGRRLPTDEQIPVLEHAYGIPFEGFYSERALAITLAVIPDEEER